MKILVIYNENSGKGKIKKDIDIITNTLSNYRFEYDLCPISIKEGINKKTLLVLHEYHTIITAGGDGTINTIINSVMKIKKEERPKLLFLPYGTTNDTSTMLGLKQNLINNLALLKTNSFHQMDIYQANDSYFVYASAIGKLTKTSYDIDRKFLKNFGIIGYFVNGLRDLFKRYKIKVTITNKEEQLTTNTFLILLVASNRLAGFSMKKFSKNHKLNNGLIDIRVFKYKSCFSWIKLVLFYLLKGVKFKSDLHLTVNEIDILIDKPLSWNIDGERGPLGNLHLKVIKEAITVYVNPEVSSKLF